MNNFFLFSAYFTPYEDETDEILKKVFLKDDIINLKISAQKLNLHCLQWISYESKTFFNSKQLEEIQTKELPILQNDPLIKKELLEQIVEL